MRLDWDGMSNVRDLGGIPVENGGTTRSGVFARSDHPGRLSQEGWRQLREYGVRSIVSLETMGLERAEDLRSNRPVEVPADVDARVYRVPVEDGSDQGFMDRWARTGLWGTPLYFSDALTRWPRLYGAALNEIAAAPRGVLLHCGRGHDRTGITVLVVLTLSGATVAGVTGDYLLSIENQRSRDPRAAGLFDDAMMNSGRTTSESIEAAMAVINQKWLANAEVSRETVSSLRCSLAPDA